MSSTRRLERQQRANNAIPIIKCNVCRKPLGPDWKVAHAECATLRVKQYTDCMRGGGDATRR